MGFSFFMLLMGLIIPITMIIFGRLFWKKAPNNINNVFGYRSAMSMKNRDTWNYAHKYCGKLWFICGIVIVPLSVIPMITVFGKDDNTVGTVGAIITAVQIIPLIGSVILTERGLRKAFDKNGKRR